MDKCVMCGKSIPEGRQVCWQCEFKIMRKCERCMYEDTDVCLKCKYWKYGNYKTKE